MDNQFQKFTDHLKTISPTERERASMWSHLESYVDFHPIAASPVQMTRSLWTHISSRFALIALSFLLVVSLSSGTTFLAEQSLPGDILYPLKLGVTEPLVSTLALSPEARASRSTELAVRRLEEASQLIATAQLTPENSALLESNLKKQIDASDESARALETNGDTGLALAARTELEKRLTIQTQKIHNADAVIGATSSSSTSLFINTVDSDTQTVTEERMQYENRMLIHVEQDEHGHAGGHSDSNTSKTQHQGQPLPIQRGVDQSQGHGDGGEHTNSIIKQ